MCLSGAGCSSGPPMSRWRPRAQRQDTHMSIGAMEPGAAFSAMSWPGPQCTAIRGHSARKKATRAPLLGCLGLITQAGTCLFRIDCDSKGSYQTPHAAWAPATLHGCCFWRFLQPGTPDPGISLHPFTAAPALPPVPDGCPVGVTWLPQVRPKCCPSPGGRCSGCRGSWPGVGTDVSLSLPVCAWVCTGVCAWVCVRVCECVRAHTCMRMKERHRVESDWR